MQEVEEQIVCVNQKSNFFVGGWQDDGARGPASARATLTRNEEKVPLCRGAGQNISPRPGKRRKNLTRNETKSHRLHHRRVEEEQSAEAHVPKPSGREKVP